MLERKSFLVRRALELVLCNPETEGSRPVEDDDKELFCVMVQGIDFKRYDEKLVQSMFADSVGHKWILEDYFDRLKISPGDQQTALFEYFCESQQRNPTVIADPKWIGRVVETFKTTTPTHIYDVEFCSANFDTVKNAVNEAAEEMKASQEAFDKAESSAKDDADKAVTAAEKSLDEAKKQLKEAQEELKHAKDAAEEALLIVSRCQSQVDFLATQFKTARGHADDAAAKAAEYESADTADAVKVFEGAVTQMNAILEKNKSTLTEAEGALETAKEAHGKAVEAEQKAISDVNAATARLAEKHDKRNKLSSEELESAAASLKTAKDAHSRLCRVSVFSQRSLIDAQINAMEPVKQKKRKRSGSHPAALCTLAAAVDVADGRSDDGGARDPFTQGKCTVCMMRKQAIKDKCKRTNKHRYRDKCYACYRARQNKNKAAKSIARDAAIEEQQRIIQAA